jgi:ferritin-like metal-binding protein YciE
MAINSLQDLYIAKLQMTYDAEQQGLEAMPAMAKELGRAELRQAFDTHRLQTEQHARRLEQILESSGESVKRRDCKSMSALIAEAQAQLGKIDDESTRDAFLVAAQQSIEHHEIADYGTLRTWARELGRDEDARLLQQTLGEEEQADRLLSDIAERRVNQEAAGSDSARGDREVARGAVAGDRSTSGANAVGDASSVRGGTYDGTRDVTP